MVFIKILYSFSVQVLRDVEETHYATNGELDRAIDDRYIEGYKVNTLCDFGFKWINNSTFEGLVRQSDLLLPIPVFYKAIFSSPISTHICSEKNAHRDLDYHGDRHHIWRLDLLRHSFLLHSSQQLLESKQARMVLRHRSNLDNQRMLEYLYGYADYTFTLTRA